MNNPGKARRVLLVEDHADTRDALGMYLEMQGYDVRMAATKKEALVLFAEHRPHVLISDVGLPDGTGWDLLHEIQGCGPIYAIALTGLGGGVDRLTSESVGFHHHITKPFDPAELDRALQAVPRTAD